MGCTLNCDPNWLRVFSPRIASVATRALNCGLYCFLVVVIELSLSMTPPNFSLLPGLNSWDHYKGFPVPRGRGGVYREQHQVRVLGEHVNQSSTGLLQTDSDRPATKTPL